MLNDLVCCNKTQTEHFCPKRATFYQPRPRFKSEEVTFTQAVKCDSSTLFMKNMWNSYKMYKFEF
jgi:hypothetical protein